MKPFVVVTATHFVTALGHHRYIRTRAHFVTAKTQTAAVRRMEKELELKGKERKGGWGHAVIRSSGFPAQGDRLIADCFRRNGVRA